MEAAGNLITFSVHRSATEEGGRPRLGTFLDSMYLVGITFFAIGYGDYFPLTYCGRGVSITCGLMVRNFFPHTSAHNQATYCN